MFVLGFAFFCFVFFLRLQRPSGLCEKTSHKDVPITGSLLRINKLLLLIGSLQSLGVHSTSCRSVLCNRPGGFYYFWGSSMQLNIRKSCQVATKHTKRSLRQQTYGSVWLSHKHECLEETYVVKQCDFSPFQCIVSIDRPFKPICVSVCHQELLLSRTRWMSGCATSMEHFSVQCNVPWGVSLED